MAPHFLSFAQSPAGRQPARRSRLLPLLAAAALIFVAARAAIWSHGRSSGADQLEITQHSVSAVAGTAASGALAVGDASATVSKKAGGPRMPAVDLVACMAEANTTGGRAMTTDMYLSGEPTRWRADLSSSLLAVSPLASYSLAMLRRLDVWH